MTAVRFLEGDDVDDLATPGDYVDPVRDAYRQRGEGAPAKPRTALFRENPSGMFTTYAAILPDTGAMGGYVYSAGFGAGDAWFLAPLFDADTGELQAVVDGASMNPFKTGAAGAVGVDALARADASDLGIVGSGPQARGQLLATATVRDLDRVRVYSPTKAHREAFAEEMDERLAADVSAVDRSSDAVRDADVVVTATDAAEPVFDGEDLTPGTHVTAMGQYHPKKRELDATTIARSVYVPDLGERVRRDAGSYIGALAEGAIEEDHVHAELGAVVSGSAPGRTDDDQITVFDSGGTGIETVAAAAMLYERAVEADRGTTIEFTPASEGLTGR